MKPSEILIQAERESCDTVEIKEVSTGKVGVANRYGLGGGIAVFYGAEDGSDDDVISVEDFDARFEITHVIRGKW